MIIEELVQAIHCKNDVRSHVSRKQLRILLEHLIFTAAGLRDAYLVDGVCLSAVTADSILKYSQQQLKLADFADVRILSLGEDIIYVNLSSLRTRLLHDSRAFSSVIVNIDGSSPVIVDHLELPMRKVCDLIIAGGAAGSNSLQIASESLSEVQIVGFTAIAGYLLGYPVVYHSSNNYSSINALSGQMLRKFSVIIKSKHTDETSLQEFTVPCCLTACEPDIFHCVERSLDSKLEAINALMPQIMSVFPDYNRIASYRYEDIIVDSVIV
jgi:hypothetical protein